MQDRADPHAANAPSSKLTLHWPASRLTRRSLRSSNAKVDRSHLPCRHPTALEPNWRSTMGNMGFAMEKTNASKSLANREGLARRRDRLLPDWRK